jgi:ADP-ribose pyrophosphatase
MKKVIPGNALLIPINAESVYKGVIYETFHWPQTLFDGSSTTFEMLRRSDTVKVICIVEDKIVVIDDEQVHSGSRKGFPGGRVDNTDLSIVDAAKREVKEETGYSFNNFKLIDVVQPYDDVEWFVHTFVAYDVTEKQEPKNDPGEKTTVHLMEFSDLKKNLTNPEYDFHANDLFSEIEATEELKGIPEFIGLSVDR